jgi:glycosyltransferase involved in cell wall biosynthesis
MTTVLFLSLMNGSAWGGSEELWYKTALWMSSNNYTVGISCYYWDEKKHKLAALEKSGCAIHLLPERKITKSFLGKWKLKKAVAAIPFEKYDLVVVNQGGWEEVLHRPYKKLYQRLNCYVLCYHNYNVNATLPYAKQKNLKRWVNNAAKNIVLSGKIIEMLQKNFAITLPAAIIYYNPITFTPPQQATVYPAVDNAAVLWIMLAELDIYRKGQDVLIKTLAQQKWKNRNWQLHLYGKGKDEAQLAQLIRQYGLQQKIILKGFTTAIKTVLEQCHFVLQITHIDAMPLTVVEALAMARPCVVSNVGDMPQWVTPGYNGFVCPAATEKDIDEVLETCWQQQCNWPALSTHAFETFCKKYPQPYEEKMTTLLADCLDKTE